MVRGSEGEARCHMLIGGGEDRRNCGTMVIFVRLLTSVRCERGGMPREPECCMDITLVGERSAAPAKEHGGVQRLHSLGSRDASLHPPSSCHMSHVSFGDPRGVGGRVRSYGLQRGKGGDL